METNGTKLKFVDETGKDLEYGADENVTPTDPTQVHPHPFPRRESSLKQKSVMKQGHLRVKEDGTKVFKKTPSQAIMAATQLGIGYSVGRLSATRERDILMVDFYFVEKVFFPSNGTKETPSHKHNDFRFKSYAPVAFRYFRDLFRIQPSDFLLSLASEPIREIGNPGASGSLFFVSNDDMFIVKTVQHKEATFLQQLLPGYYMNIHQNPRTLLPKFFGLYCYQSGTSNIRLTVMNNLLPRKYKCHIKFDLKGSTYKRKASKSERAKKSPVYKDLDFQQMFPDGIQLDAETYDAVIKTISRDTRVLESFNIMDYSFLLGIHNLDEAERERETSRLNSMSQDVGSNPDREARTNEFNAALEAIPLEEDEDDKDRPVGGVPAKNDKGERLILFIGIIDILQSYRLAKKMEHGWKSLLTDGDTVSVHKPSYYSIRFLNFIKNEVFKRAVNRSAMKRRSVRTSEYFGDKSDLATSLHEQLPPTGIDEKTDRMVTIQDPDPGLGGSIDCLSSASVSSEDLLEGSSSENIAMSMDNVAVVGTSSDNVTIEHSLPVDNTNGELEKITENGGSTGSIGASVGSSTEISNSTVAEDVDVVLKKDIVNLNEIHISTDETEILEKNVSYSTSET